ncbi:MAG: hypothetical protein KDB14_18395 [Planctomycetales bacterium]|nr:hypothetical protein [Planctomycetales bacterium]
MKQQEPSAPKPAPVAAKSNEPKAAQDASERVAKSPAGASTPKQSAEDEDWLPPGNTVSVPTPSAEDRTSAPTDDDWLPPAPEDDTPGEQVALPTGASLAASAGEVKGPAMATEDGQIVMLREPVRKVGVGEDEQEIRLLTPEERAARRLKKNLIVWALGLIVLIATMYFMR